MGLALRRLTCRLPRKCCEGFNLCKERARKRDAPQGAVPCVFEIALQRRETISLAQ